MARCDVCGGWAGFFQHRHDGCRPISFIPALPVQQTHLPPPLESPTLLIPPTVNDFAGMCYSGTRPELDHPAPRFVAAAFTLKGTAESNYIQRLFPVTRTQYQNLTSSRRGRAFVIDGFVDAMQVRQVRDALCVLIENGGTAAEFRKWVGDLAARFGVGWIDPKVVDKTFDRYTRRAYGLNRRTQLSHPAVMDALPYWQYFAFGEGTKKVHAALDGFVAHNCDPVWKKIYPKGGARATVIALSGDQALEQDPRAAEDGYSRLPEIARSHFYPAR